MSEIIAAPRIIPNITSAAVRKSLAFPCGTSLCAIRFVSSNESTGVETFFRDMRDPDSCSRRVFALHKPALEIQS